MYAEDDDYLDERVPQSDNYGEQEDEEIPNEIWQEACWIVISAYFEEKGQFLKDELAIIMKGQFLKDELAINMNYGGWYMVSARGLEYGGSWVRIPKLALEAGDPTSWGKGAFCL